MKSLLETRLVEPIRRLLSQGLSPRMLALSLAVGLVVGIFPVLGTTTLLCTLAAVVLRLNLVAVQTVHFLMTPVQLLMIIPFVRVGERILGRAPQSLSVSKGLDLITQDAFNAIRVLWNAILHAMLGWFLLGPAILIVIYLVFARVLSLAQRSIVPATPAKGHP